jgi:hypothetical protein
MKQNRQQPQTRKLAAKAQTKARLTVRSTQDTGKIRHKTTAHLHNLNSRNSHHINTRHPLCAISI